MSDHKFKPESLMMTYGFKPEWSEGALKSPIFQTSTFVFKTAEEGKAMFEIAVGKRKKMPDEKIGLIYSRINNPDLEILENRLCLWDEAEECAVFESGMSAITTVLLEFLKPGEVLLYSTPIYGGTDHFIHFFLNKIGVEVIGFKPGLNENDLLSFIESTGKKDKIGFIFLETPANPTNDLVDIEACKNIAKKLSRPDKEVLVGVDNTYMGPLWQHPLKFGADIVMYSATKYIGGHSDVIAGAVLGKSEHIKKVKSLRTLFGNMAGPWTGWLLLRSLETLKVRMDQQAKNAFEIAKYLKSHPKIDKVYYLGFIDKESHSYKIFQKQCLSAGAMVSFDIKGGEAEAFKFLNHLKLIKLAVSLGSTESLAEHPFSMTHSSVPDDMLNEMGVTDQMVRLSVGVEHYQDIIWDIEQALQQV